MNQEFLLEHVDNFYKAGIGLIRKKNADYADNADPFKNFRACEILGIDPALGILLRKLDKIVRVANLLTRDPKVTSESILDSLLDDANYSALLAAFLTDRTMRNRAVHNEPAPAAPSPVQ